MSLAPTLPLVVFSVGSLTAALPSESVQAIILMAELTRPPGLPDVLEGILNLHGTGVPVLRLSRLLQQPQPPLALYSMILLLKDTAGPLALLVERVENVLQVNQNDLMPVPAQDSFNACVEAVATIGGRDIYLLSPGQILLAKERDTLAAFRFLEQSRLNVWLPEVQ